MFGKSSINSGIGAGLVVSVEETIGSLEVSGLTIPILHPTPLIQFNQPQVILF
jgi:hypothetical protein